MSTKTVTVPEDRYFTTSDGVKLHYRVCGSGDPLVLLPGYSETVETFDGNYEELQKHFLVYTMEYRAHGKSEAPTHGYHTERLAADFKELMDAEGLDQVSVIAHSMGNSVLWCYTELFGQDRIRKYVLEEEGSTFLSDPAWSEAEQRTYRGVMDWDMYLNTSMLSMMVQAQEGESASHLAVRRDGMARLWKDHLANDWSDIIPTLRIPTLIVMGAKSHFATQELWDFTRNSIVGSEFAVVEEAGHGVHVEAPEKFNELAIRFLTK